MFAYLIAVAAATVAWFVAAALFFNRPVDAIYRSEESHPSVRALPQRPETIGKILAAVAIQCAVWAGVYLLIQPALSGEWLADGALFGLVIAAVKVLPRDIDRVLLTTYPSKRMTIEFVIGLVCALVVGLVFSLIL